MNPLTNVKNIQKLNDKILQMGVEDGVSWHKQYKDSAYIFIGGLPYDLSEGDILCVFSQYGEIVDVNLVRDKSSGKSKGYGFLCYEDQRSTILAVDNLNGIKLGSRTIRVDHVSNYRRPKGDEVDEDGERKEKPLLSCAPKTPPTSENDEADEQVLAEEGKKKKKKKKEKSKKRLKDSKKSKEIVKGMKGDKRELSPGLERESKVQKVKRQNEDKDGIKIKRNNEKRWDGVFEREIDEDKSLDRGRERKNDKDTGRERDRENIARKDAERIIDKDTYMEYDRDVDNGKRKEKNRESKRERTKEKDRKRYTERDIERDGERRKR